MKVKGRNIVLVGFMGTGKTTVGRALAEKLGWTFVDVDAVVVRREGMTIAEMFERHGEPFFRRAETDALRDLLAGGRQVLATGGGAVLEQHNRRLMSDGGLVVALYASAETVIARVAGDSGRPLLQGHPEERIRSLLKAREGAYGFAQTAIDTDALTVDEVVQLILAQLHT